MEKDIFHILMEELEEKCNNLCNNLSSRRIDITRKDILIVGKGQM